MTRSVSMMTASLVLALLWAVLLAATTGRSAEVTSSAQRAPVAPPVHPAVYWATANGSTQVTLVDRGTADYTLVVVSTAKSLKVTYHTAVNSSKAVTTELTPLKGSKAPVYRYQVKHAFSRTTIWMGLTFTINGKPAGELTRAFYDGIEKSVPIEQFLKPSTR